MTLDRPPMPIHLEDDDHGRRLREANAVWQQSSATRRSRILSKVRSAIRRQSPIYLGACHAHQ